MNSSRKRGLESQDIGADEPEKRIALEVDPPSNGLCERCTGIDWALLEREAPLSRSGKVLAMIDPLKEDLRLSPCRVCKLLGLIMPASLDAKTCQLRAISSRISFAYLKKSTPRGPLPPPDDVPECTVMYMNRAQTSHQYKRGWHQTGCLLLGGVKVRDADCGAREVLPHKINYRLIKQWIAGCKHRHQKTCARPKGPFPGGLRVVDCDTKRVILAPGRCKYVALSYVWGPTPQGAGTDEGFSPVVEDSMLVASSLGFRYLWVDKHCIDQKSPDKQEQIARMDLVYSQAELTIIAAAGSTAGYGLPGVAMTARRRQFTTNIGPVRLTYIPPHTSFTLRSSIWASRGWTYQESILSRQRLIFTDDQIAWVCNAWHNCESTAMPPESFVGIEDNPFQGFVPKMVRSMRKRYMDIGNLKDFQEIKTHIMEYSSRKLTHDSDALNAILSIFESTQAVKRGLAGDEARYSLFYHLHGLPVKVSPVTENTLVPLGWYHGLPAQRRGDFPSWSWTGWKGAVCMNDPDTHVSRDCTAEVLVGEDILSLASYVERINSPEYAKDISPTKDLIITGKTIPVSLVGMGWGKLNESFSQRNRVDSVRFVDGPHVKLPIGPNIWAYTYAYMDDDSPICGELLGLILGKQLSKKALGILLLRPHGDDFKRVGILRYRDGRGTQPGGTNIPHIVYVDDKDQVLDDVENVEGSPMWLREAVVKTIRLT